MSKSKKSKIRNISAAVFFATALILLCKVLMTSSQDLLIKLGAFNLAMHAGSIVLTAATGQLAVLHLSNINRSYFLMRNYLAICIANSAVSLLFLYNAVYGWSDSYAGVCLLIWGCGHLTIFYALMNSFSYYFQLPSHWRSMIPLTFIGLAISLSLGLYIGNPAKNSVELGMQISVMRELFILIGLFSMVMLCGFFKPFTLSHKFFESLNQRLLLSSDGSLHKSMLALIFITSLMLSFFGVSWLLNDPNHTVGVISLAPVAILYSLLYQLYYQHSEVGLTGNTVNQSATLFQDRYLNDPEIKAAVAGNKTATFLIDHDPFQKFTKELPAGLLQIRNEEVMKCVDLTLGEKQIHGQFINNQVYGAINPEMSERPCVDALILFGCLFLDASPLIERKLASLFEVLPIIDPELHSLVDGKGDLSHLFNKNDWFYYFNYRWVDQWAAVHGKQSQYRVNLNTLPISDFIHIHRQLSDESADTQHIIIGEEARDRLLFEAPSIGERLKPYPIRVEDREIIVFAIDLETLILMLDQYFDLSAAREKLRDYAPGEENMKILDICDEQVRLINKLSDIKVLVKTVMNHTWHGFIEKGRVLKVISAAFARAKDLIVDEKKVSPDMMALLLEAVKRVGYPSQLLHSAQMQKLALRDRRRILQVAGNPGHIRFVEAWVYLANLQPHSFPAEAIQDILHFLLSVPSKTSLSENVVVQFKATDCLINLAKDPLIMDGDILERLLASFLTWASARRFSTRQCSLLIDGMIYLLHCRQGTFKVPEKELFIFQAYITELNQIPAASADELQRVNLRLKQLLERLSLHNSKFVA